MSPGTSRGKKARPGALLSPSLALVPVVAGVMLARVALARSSELAPAIAFVDRALSAGLDSPTTYGSAQASTYILETTGTGAAFLDYDRDGRLDVFLTNGTTLAGAKSPAPPRCALYHNRGNGTFEDVSLAAGIVRSGWGQGIAVGDYDNDGFPDVYLTFFGQNVLFHNNGNGTFRDVTAAAGVAAGGWSTSAAFSDYDRDGRLDLYVAKYVDFDLKSAPLPGSQRNCFYSGFPVMCGPRGLAGGRDVLYHNNGDGSFTDVTVAAGDLDRERLRGLGVAWGDYDDDGFPDLLVANDAHPNLLYHNERNGTFKEVGLEAGVAFDEDGRERAGMGVDFGDYDNDGRLDIVVTNFQGEPNALYRNLGNGTFQETTWSASLGQPTLPSLGWGTAFVDFDNDGLRDLFFVNGHVYPEVERHKLDETYAQRSRVFRNRGGDGFADVSDAAGRDLAVPRVGRGAAFGDYDEDGRVDVLIANVNDRPVLLHNESGGANHWLSVRLVGRPSNRDGIGARIVAQASDRRWMAEVQAGRSYLSQSDPRAHFGLGALDALASLEVRWPSGTVDRIENPPLDRTIVIEEGRSTPPMKEARGLPRRP